MTKELWETEGDERDFEASGLKCAMRRGPGGNWCGYVGVSTEHPLHSVSYSDRVKAPAELLREPVDMDRVSLIALLCQGKDGDKVLDEGLYTLDVLLRVHGGITWSRDHHGREKKKDGLWWFGFYCAHAGDLAPKHEIHYSIDMGNVYRDAEYVAAECRSLANQLAKWEAWER